MKALLPLFVISSLAILPAVSAPKADSDAQSITLVHSLQVPGEVLKPGAYTFSLEDRLSGRAIVLIANSTSGDHRLLLAVPSANINDHPTNGLVLFASHDATQQVLRAWLCPGCAKPLELVYPKEEAAQITADTGETVLAADPSYDKLPADLSPDDMRVVTLWLLSPERVANNRGVGLKAAKYVPARLNLPQTASNMYSFLVASLILLAGFLALRVSRLRRLPCAH
jgi:hypothetical protein